MIAKCAPGFRSSAAQRFAVFGVSGTPLVSNIKRVTTSVIEGPPTLVAASRLPQYESATSPAIDCPLHDRKTPTSIGGLSATSREERELRVCRTVLKLPRFFFSSSPAEALLCQP